MGTIDLSVKIGTLLLANPVMVASGTFGYGEEYAALMDCNKLGAVVTKGISLNPSAGNLPPRIVETPSGMLNAIGLQNVGLERFVAEKMPFLRSIKAAVVVNFYGASIDEYVALAERLDSVEGIDALEANISCPNIKAGGIAFGTSADMAGRVTAAIREVTGLPLIVKLTPNVTDITVIARSAAAAGADALSLTNTFTGMVVDTDTRRPALANISGGLSGPAIRPLALYNVWQVAGAVDIPVIGIGGITDTQDALQFLIAGAQAVQIGTALFVNPRSAQEIAAGLAAYVSRQGHGSIGDIIGSLET
ncbi:dihydroorotate dehydrogenase [Thermodesulfobacteriota bacterium]